MGKTCFVCNQKIGMFDVSPLNKTMIEKKKWFVPENMGPKDVVCITCQDMLFSKRPRKTSESDTSSSVTKTDSDVSQMTPQQMQQLQLETLLEIKKLLHKQLTLIESLTSKF